MNRFARNSRNEILCQPIKRKMRYRITTKENNSVKTGFQIRFPFYNDWINPIVPIHTDFLLWDKHLTSAKSCPGKKKYLCQNYIQC